MRWLAGMMIVDHGIMVVHRHQYGIPHREVFVLVSGWLYRHVHSLGMANIDFNLLAFDRDDST